VDRPAKTDTALSPWLLKQQEIWKEGREKKGGKKGRRKDIEARSCSNRRRVLCRTQSRPRLCLDRSAVRGEGKEGRKGPANEWTTQHRLSPLGSEKKKKRGKGGGKRSASYLFLVFITGGGWGKVKVLEGRVCSIQPPLNTIIPQLSRLLP